MDRMDRLPAAAGHVAMPANRPSAGTDELVDHQLLA
jgi:hypothetical protein